MEINKAKNNRRKGHDAERFYAEKFRELGYPHCRTARQGSRLHDDAGIDLIFIPYNVQVKAGQQRGLNPVNVLKDMEEKISKIFPQDNPEHKFPNIVVLRKQVGKGIKRTKYDDVVVLSFKDFEQFINKNDETRNK